MNVNLGLRRLLEFSLCNAVPVIALHMVLQSYCSIAFATDNTNKSTVARKQHRPKEQPARKSPQPTESFSLAASTKALAQTFHRRALDNALKNEWYKAACDESCALTYDPTNSIYKANTVNYRLKAMDKAISAEDFEEVVSQCTEILTIDPQNQNAKLNKELYIAKLNKIKSAAKAAIMTPVRTGQPVQNQLTEWNNKGVRLLNMQEYDDAIKMFEKALQLDPQYKQGRLNLAIAMNNLALKLAGEDQKEKALEQFASAYLIDPANPTTKKNIETIVTRFGRNPQIDSDRTAIGKMMQRNGFFNAAIEEYQAALLLKESAPTRERLGDVYRVRWNDTMAIKEYSQAIAIKDSASLRVKLAQALQAQGDLTGAVAHLQAALNMEPENNEVTDAMETAWDGVIKQNPTSPDNHIGLGQAMQMNGRFDEARKEYELAIRFSPGRVNPTASNFLLRLDEAKEKHQAATSVKSLEKIAAISQPSITAPEANAPAPGAGAARSININQLMMEKRYAEAGAALDFALKTTPLDASAWFNYGVCREAQKDYHGALAAYEMVTTLSPSDTVAKSAAAAIRVFVDKQKDEKARLALNAQNKQREIEEVQRLLSAKNFSEAMVLVNKRLKEEPSSNQLWFNLGVCKQGLKDNHGALAAYEMAQRLNNQSAVSAIQEVRTLLSE